MLKSIAILTAVLGAVLPALAQQPPHQVAPEYREQAEKRAEEKRHIADCQHKADVAKVLVRDRTKFVIDCLEHPQAETAPKLTIERKL